MLEKCSYIIKLNYFWKTSILGIRSSSTCICSLVAAQADHHQYIQTKVKEEACPFRSCILESFKIQNGLQCSKYYLISFTTIQGK